MLDILPQLIMNGLIAGAIYSLASLGLNLIFGVLGFVNFAYGDMIMVGSYLFDSQQYHLRRIKQSCSHTSLSCTTRHKELCVFDYIM
ncbi:MAG: hypothetical protein U1D98_04950, partial [Candidatus Gracilibacteria bacterium]|nr:hypothetical protein [Candidatus Gracilibacteria bacterium]